MGRQSQFEMRKNRASSSSRKRHWLASLSALALIAVTATPGWATSSDSSSPSLTSMATVSPPTEQESATVLAPTESVMPTEVPSETATQSTAPTESISPTTTTEDSSPGSTVSPTASSEATTESASDISDGALTDSEDEPWIVFDDEPSVGDTITIEAAYFESGSTVTIEFRTENGNNVWHTLNQLVDKDGIVRFEFTIPDEAPLGEGDVYIFDEAGRQATHPLYIFRGADSTCEGDLKATLEKSKLNPGTQTQLNLTGAEPNQNIVLELINAESNPVDFMLEQNVSDSHPVVIDSRCSASLEVGTLKTTPDGKYTLRGVSAEGDELFNIALTILTGSVSSTPTPSPTTGEPTQSPEPNKSSEPTKDVTTAPSTPQETPGSLANTG